jgi:hypothetical protein
LSLVSDPVPARVSPEHEPHRRGIGSRDRSTGGVG